jgi:hypothetical protein
MKIFRISLHWSNYVIGNRSPGHRPGTIASIQKRHENQRESRKNQKKTANCHEAAAPLEQLLLLLLRDSFAKISQC